MRKPRTKLIKIFRRAVFLKTIWQTNFEKCWKKPINIKPDQTSLKNSQCSNIWLTNFFLRLEKTIPKWILEKNYFLFILSTKIHWTLIWNFNYSWKQIHAIWGKFKKIMHVHVDWYRLFASVCYSLKTSVCTRK